MSEPEIESPYNRVATEPAKDTISVPEWLDELLKEKKVLPIKRTTWPTKKELHGIMQSAVDRAILELERALEIIRQENK